MIETLFSQPPIYLALPLFLTAVGALLFGGPSHTPTNIYLMIGCVVAETLVMMAISSSSEQMARQWAHTSVAVMVLWLAVTPLFNYVWR